MQIEETINKLENLHIWGVKLNFLGKVYLLSGNNHFGKFIRMIKYYYYHFRLASVHYVKAIKRPGVHLTLHFIKCDSKIILGTEKFNLSHFHYYGSYLVLKSPRKQSPHFGSH